jgi:hypothetical protein
VAPRVIPAFGEPTRAGRGARPRHCGLLSCTGPGTSTGTGRSRCHTRSHTRTPPESGQHRREAHERYGGIGSEARDAHGVDPEPPEQDPAAAKCENRDSELT